MDVAAENRGTPLEWAGDVVLWPQCVRGDAEAFGVLFDRHRDRVFRSASRLSDNRQDAEDVAASAFLELWRRRDDVRVVDGSILPWLLVTTANLGRNAARSRRRYRDLLGRLPRYEDAPDTAAVVLDARGLGVDARLRDGLRKLSATDAQLIALVVLDGYRVAVAAELLGLSESSARSRLHRSRQKLKEQFGPGSGHDRDRDPGGLR
jgi:RNA polymerase sigma factor (sigma-70 family)